MSQKFVKFQNQNDKSTAYKKWYARAVYNRKAVSTDEIAEFIQDNASVTRADVKAVLDQLGTAINYFFRRGEKVYLKDIGTFKVGFSSLGQTKPEFVTANTIINPRVLFQPEIQHVSDNTVKVSTDKQGNTRSYTGYTVRKKMLEGIEFEESYEKKSAAEEQ